MAARREGDIVLYVVIMRHGDNVDGVRRRPGGEVTVHQTATAPGGRPGEDARPARGRRGGAGDADNDDLGGRRDKDDHTMR